MTKGRAVSGFRVGKYHAEFVDVRITRRSHGTLDYWDGNWVDAKIEVDAGGFRALYDAYLRAEELLRFRDDLARLYSFDADEAVFETMEKQLSMHIKGDGLGHFSAACVAVDELGIGNRLAFTLEFDQTELLQTLRALDAVVKEFPVVGDPND